MTLLSLPQLSGTEVAAFSAIIIKFFLSGCRTMPPPPEKCSYLFRWAYDWAQDLASNADKVGKSRAPDAKSASA